MKSKALSFLALVMAKCNEHTKLCLAANRSFQKMHNSKKANSSPTPSIYVFKRVHALIVKEICVASTADLSRFFLQIENSEENNLAIVKIAQVVVSLLAKLHKQ